MLVKGATVQSYDYPIVKEITLKNTWAIFYLYCTIHTRPLLPLAYAIIHSGTYKSDLGDQLSNCQLLVNISDIDD